MGKQAIEGASRFSGFNIDPDKVKLAHIDFECRPGDPLYNPRNLKPVPEWFIESVLEDGVLQPIGLVKDGEDLIVVYGNQRVRAAREANKRLTAMQQPRIAVPSLAPLRGFSENDLGRVTLVENEHRIETDAVDKAKLAALHLRRVGGNVKEAAKAFRISEAQFQQLLSIHESSDEVKQAITDGDISASAGAVVSKLPRAKQSKNLKKVISKGGTTDAAKNTVRKEQGTLDKTKPTMSLIKAMRTKLEDTALSGDEGFDEGFKMALKWVGGEVGAKQVKGLSPLISQVSK